MNTRLLPLIGFVLLLALLGFGIWWSQHHAMNEVPSPLIDKPAPEFTLPVFADPARTVSREQLLGEPYLLNVFASWCFACREEHPLWMSQARRLGVKVVGLNYKDETADAQRWLAQYGDPYDIIAVDRDGRVAIDFGVYGAPETFLVDAAGVIRYKRIGPLTTQVLATELAPAIAALGSKR